MNSSTNPSTSKTNIQQKTEKKRIVLLTGANGFIGTYIAQELLQKKDVQILAMVRGKNDLDAKIRLKRAWWEYPDLIKSLNAGKIKILRGDVTAKNLGLEDLHYNHLIQNLTHIIHTVADLRLDAPLDELRKTNVIGTKNVLFLAQKVDENHGLERFSFLSTAYVAGKREGDILESDLSSQSGFSSNYEKSKFEAENEVKKSKISFSIFRPGMVVGDSKTGQIKTFNTIYVPLRLYLTGKLRFLPISPSSKINLVPVDYVGQSVVDLTFNDKAQNLTFHLTAPNESLPSVGELIEYTRKWTYTNLGFSLPRPIFLPLPQSWAEKILKFLFKGSNVSSNRNSGLIKESDFNNNNNNNNNNDDSNHTAQSNQKLSLKKVKSGKGFDKSVLGILAPYIQENRNFNRKNTEQLTGPYPHGWKDFIDNILKYAVYTGFFHRSERTVHEQIMYRLKSKSFPVEYVDIINGHLIEQKGPDLRKKIIKAVHALQELGIVPQDRVAILGFNSTRYFILDVAIGLIGAVSVPLYYTSPLNEIKDLIKDSSSKLLLLGNQDVLKQINELDLEIPVVSFARESEVRSENAEENFKEHQKHLPNSPIINWEEFLKMGLDNTPSKDKEDIFKSKNEVKNVKNPEQTQKTLQDEIRAPVDFESLATIRYTSGTTGNPNGVMFNHGNLRWMAEFIASMPPWKDRIHKISYLSFLPMNHVVEGILGNYAPYYAPAPLKLYFLEDFQELPQILPQVKPKVFFSVPRFYEKLWDSFQENTWGKIYCKIRTSRGMKIILNRYLSNFLGNLLLKKAGLDNCSQLIVGSAPISESLIKEFQKLGIQVHNAYGLTEAPLITINRLGDNQAHTVGKPLPRTHIQIGMDGEVLVKGPQVTSGYFKKDNNTLFSEDWLLTGDYGYLTEDGSLVITGRKKEVIINSYGKTISPLKMEVLLKSIPGISEVMVVGEQKPYCIGLIWVDKTPESLSKLDESIRNINSSLSHPEQVKRWAILKNDLSIDKGDLTANLKLKRKFIIERYDEVINCLYEGKISDNMLHLGSTEDIRNFKVLE
jgi:long-chain acyl-CoA synthetase